MSRTDDYRRRLYKEQLQNERPPRSLEDVGPLGEALHEHVPQHQVFNLNALAAGYATRLVAAALTPRHAEYGFSRTFCVRQLTVAAYKALPRCLSLLSALCGCDFNTHNAHHELPQLFKALCACVRSKALLSTGRTR